MIKLTLAALVLVVFSLGLVVATLVAQPAVPPAGPACESERQWLLVFADQLQRSRSQLEIQSAQRIAELNTEIGQLRTALTAATKVKAAGDTPPNATKPDEK